jgi:hypothetical protein
MLDSDPNRPRRNEVRELCACLNAIGLGCLLTCLAAIFGSLL